MLSPEKLRAKMHSVECRWRLRTTRQVVIGPEPRLVLALRALRDVELRFVRVDFPDLALSSGEAESMLAEVPHVVGLRTLRAEGEPWVDGQEDAADAFDMLSAIGPLKEQRWDGRTIELITHNVNRHPASYWVCALRAHVPQGLGVGLVIRADRATVCRAQLAGTN